MGLRADRDCIPVTPHGTSPGEGLRPRNTPEGHKALLAAQDTPAAAGWVR